MGTIETIDPYCGKDPFFNVTHIATDPNFHYPGCGLDSKYCTKLPCCEVVEQNNDKADDCSSENSYRIGYDESTKTFSTSFISCFDQIYECFITNQQFRGQCCECDEGWGGIDCTIPLCKEKCLNGYCVSKDTCECFKGYAGRVCELRKFVYFNQC